MHIFWRTCVFLNRHHTIKQTVGGIYLFAFLPLESSAPSCTLWGWWHPHRQSQHRTENSRQRQQQQQGGSFFLINTKPLSLNARLSLGDCQCTISIHLLIDRARSGVPQTWEHCWWNICMLMYAYYCTIVVASCFSLSFYHLGWIYFGITVPIMLCM